MTNVPSLGRLRLEHGLISLFGSIVVHCSILFPPSPVPGVLALIDSCRADSPNESFKMSARLRADYLTQKMISICLLICLAFWRTVRAEQRTQSLVYR